MIEKLIKILKTDPKITGGSMNYIKDGTLESYLRELKYKHGSILHGIIIALERELEK